MSDLPVLVKSGPGEITPDQLKILIMQALEAKKAAGQGDPEQMMIAQRLLEQLQQNLQNPPLAGELAKKAKTIYESQTPRYPLTDLIRPLLGGE